MDLMKFVCILSECISFIWKMQEKKKPKYLIHGNYSLKLGKVFRKDYVIQKYAWNTKKERWNW